MKFNLFATAPLISSKEQAVPTRIFDDLALVGTPGTSAAVIETSEGLILLDALWPGGLFENMLEYQLRLLGYDPADIKIVLISHGHPDHIGCAGHFVRKYGAVPYMSETDYHFGKAYYENANNPEWSFDFSVENFVGDGDAVRLGEKEIKVFSTPGHTPGGLSFIIPVQDLGEAHKAALWGGTAPPPEREACDQYLESLEYWRKVCIENGVDAEFHTHPMINNGIERMAVMRNRIDQVPNPFVVGLEGYLRITEIFKELVEDAIARRK